MTTVKTFILIAILLLCIFLTASCSERNIKPGIILTGSTPGDELIKTMLTIPADTKVDFIRWNLLLDDNYAFILDIIYGESQPNTLGFKNVNKQTIKGKYLVEKKHEGSRFKEIYQLRRDDFPEIISFVKINENLFHILTPQGRMMTGNGGWSYSLNRKGPVNSDKILISSPVPDEKSLQLVFDGRTPCREIATEHPEMNASTSCFKLKWRLILNRDSVTYLPATCSIRTIVDNEPQAVTGTWTIIKVEESNTIIYKIQIDDLAKPFMLLLADENVLFFLDKDNNPLIGNEDFSFALNKSVQ